MLLLDFSGTVHSSVNVALNPHKVRRSSFADAFDEDKGEISEGMIRHLILNSLKNSMVQFGREYGELVIAIDDKNYWRKKLFPYYKARRKNKSDSSSLDWKKIHGFIDTIKDEIQENLPYRVVGATAAEGDDVIAELVRQYSPHERIMIISADHDLIQLQNSLGDSIRQYDPVRKIELQEGDPENFLLEKIIKGDDGDDVPNIMMPDNTFVEKIRQKPMTQSRLAEFKENLPNGRGEEDHLRNFQRNTQMIDLSKTPKSIRSEIIDSFNEQKGKRRNRIMKYLATHKMRKLLESASEF